MTILAYAFISAIALLIVSNVLSIRRLIDSRAELKQLKQQLNDDNLINYLEACAETSHLAARLVCEARNQPSLNAASTDIVVHRWQHDPDVDTPPDEHWKLVYSNICIETTQEAKFAALKRWLKNGQRFTINELNELVKLFHSNYRDRVRRLLFKHS